MKKLFVHLPFAGILLALYFWAGNTTNPYDEGIFLSLLVIYAIWITYQFATPMVARYLTERALKQENATHFLLLWRVLWIGCGLIFAGVSFSGSIASVGISAAFLAMVFGWSLQGPVTGIAAWLMVIARHPFRIGDRIIISGMTGDVVDINFSHIILNQVGGTVTGEELSGRTVMIPNSILFQQVIVNYTHDSPYILDELQVVISNRSDSAQAKEILIQAASEVTADIIRETGEIPFVRVEISDKGIILRLRYKTKVQERQRITSDIMDIIIREIGNPDVKVEFSNAPKESLNPPKKDEGVSQGNPATAGASTSSTPRVAGSSQSQESGEEA